MVPLVVEAFTVPSHVYFKSGKRQYVQSSIRSKNLRTVVAADTSGNYIESEEDMANTTRLDDFYQDNIVQSKITSFSNENSIEESSLTRPYSDPNRNSIKINDQVLHEDREEENISTSGQQLINESNEKNIGIGGKDGLVYDLNKLKKNLVQEAVRQSKKELLSVFLSVSDSQSTTQKPWDDLIEDKIAALVDANPVATTTDSNLLEGQWCFSFVSDNASKILNETRFRNNEQNQGTSKMVSPPKGIPWAWHHQSGKTDNPFQSVTRLIYLENLEDNERPYLEDHISYLYGLGSVIRKYEIIGLSRTCLKLEQKSSALHIGGKLVRSMFKQQESAPPIEIHVLYLDSDLCISMNGKESLEVYTKSELWMNSTRKTRQIMLTLGRSLCSIESPFRIRRKAFSLLRSIRGSTKDEPVSRVERKEINSTLLRQEYNIDEDSKLTVLRLGGDDKSSKDDQAWPPDEDPFIRLSYKERKKVLNNKTLKDIQEIGRKEKQRAKKKKKTRSRKQKKFKRPQD